MSQPNVLIVGASIAGPTAAYWFARAGWHVTIIERFPSLRDGGQNVDIRTVGVAVMRKMGGMEEAVRARRAPMDGISFVRADGRPYGTIRPTGDPHQQSLVSEYEILRGDLAEILHGMTERDRNIRYVFGEQVATLRPADDAAPDGPLAVTFANGHPPAEYDLVVACDGATSRTRALGLGCDVRDHVTTTNIWAAYFSTPQELVEGKAGQAYSAVGGRFAAAGNNGSGGSRVAFMAIHPRDDKDAMRSFREAAKQGDAAVKRLVADTYRGAGWKCAEAVEAMEGAQDFYASEFVKVAPPSLHKGRFVLVGDAGYAGAAGSGTSLAMAGAYVLVGELGRHRADVVAGLQGYGDTMRPIVDDLQRTPPLVHTFMAPQTAWGIWLRNTIFAFVCWSRVLELGQRFFSGSFANAEKYKLPEYEWPEYE